MGMRMCRDHIFFTAVHLGYKNLGKILNGFIIFILCVNMNTMHVSS